MHLDHVSFATEPDGLEATAGRLADALGIDAYDGGIHPRFGTRNLIFPLAGGHYLEVVEPLEHPATLSTPFGQAVRARTETGGGWMGWVIRVSDLAPVEARLERAAVDGNRTPPGHDEVVWKQIGIKGLIADPQLPYFIHWLSPASEHPSSLGPRNDASIAEISIAGDRDRVRDWLGTDDKKPISEISIDWVAPHGAPGIQSVTFATPRGLVTL